MTIRARRTRGDLDDRPPKRFTPYVVGNAGAVLVGLTVAYFSLTLSSGPLSLLKWSDFISFYSAAHLFVDGHAALTYNFQALKAVQAPLYYPYHVPDGLMVYVYPPFVTLMMAPLAVLPFASAYVIRLALNIILMTASIYWLEHLSELTGKAAVALRWASFIFLPTFIGLVEGQTSAMLLLIITFGLVCLLSGRDRTAGIVLALLLMKPYYLFWILLVLVIRGQWRAIGACVSTACALIVIPLPFVGFNTYQAYARILRQAAGWHSQFGYGPQKNNTLYGALQLVLSLSAASWIYLVAGCAAIVAVAVCARRCPQLDMPFALAVVAALVMSPHTLAHDLTLLLLPASVTVNHAEAKKVVAAFLVVAYVLVTVGYGLAFRYPIQLSVVAMGAMAIALGRMSIRTPPLPSTAGLRGQFVPLRSFPLRSRGPHSDHR